MLSAGITYRQFTDNPRSSNAFTYPIVTTGDHLAYGKSDWITMPNIESISTVVGRFLDEGAQTVALMGVLPELVDEAVLRRKTEGTQALRAKDM